MVLIESKFQSFFCWVPLGPPKIKKRSKNGPDAYLWLPPGLLPDEDMLSSIFQRSVSEQIQMDVFTVFDQMNRYHPSEPHWHLPLMGVDPLKQGKGFGSALMQHALVQCDRDNKLAYLESSSPRSVPFYNRHGFELLGTIQLGASPSIFPMLRRPSWGIQHHCICKR